MEAIGSPCAPNSSKEAPPNTAKIGAPSSVTHASSTSAGSSSSCAGTGGWEKLQASAAASARVRAWPRSVEADRSHSRSASIAKPAGRASWTIQTGIPQASCSPASRSKLTNCQAATASPEAMLADTAPTAADTAGLIRPGKAWARVPMASRRPSRAAAIDPSMPISSVMCLARPSSPPTSRLKPSFDHAPSCAMPRKTSAPIAVHSNASSPAWNQRDSAASRGRGGAAGGCHSAGIAALTCRPPTSWSCRDRTRVRRPRRRRCPPAPRCRGCSDTRAEPARATRLPSRAGMARW